jgi:hypothetical protein
MLFASMAIILYASGNGIGSIARGTVPLALFGPTRYPMLMGRLGLPIMIAMAIGPYLGAWAFERGGPSWTTSLAGIFAFLYLAFVAALWMLSRSLRRADR